MEKLKHQELVQKVSESQGDADGPLGVALPSAVFTYLQDPQLDLQIYNSISSHSFSLILLALTFLPF